jgi:stage II sporulation protein D
MDPDRRRFHAAVVIAAAGAVAGLLGVPSSAVAGADREVYPVPANGVYALRGHGYGHGHGMSQFGAYGAALKGLTYQQILSFYYPTTTLTGRSLSRRVRVLLHDTSSSRLVVDPHGRKLTASTSVDGVADCKLPTTFDGGETTVSRYRVKTVRTDAGERLRLQFSTGGTSWARLPKKTCGAAWAGPLNGDVGLEGPKLTRLDRPGGGTTRYRGGLVAAFTGSRIFVVNDVLLESYLRSVVPSEMPSSWAPAALQAQTVAARTYASYGIAHPKNKPYYDVYDDTRDQMYTGVGSEIESTDAAVLATQDPAKGVAFRLEDADGRPAFTQFSSSSGGWTVSGGQSYLPAKSDPYDGVPKLSWSPHSWRTTLSASGIESAYGGQLGRLRSVEVADRDGHGDWGGRITELTLHGSAGDVTVSGSSFRYTFGLRSEWFRIVLPPARPAHVVARRAGNSVTASWQPPPEGTRATPTGYRVVAHPGGKTVTVNRDARSASLTGLATGTRYTVSVTATSGVGPSDAVTIPTTIQRVGGTTAAGLAAAGSRATFGAGSADAAVLAAATSLDRSLGAATLAAATHAPVLVAKQDGLPGPTETELRRVLPEGRTVYLLGPAELLGTELRDAVRTLGYRVVRLGGETAATTARKVATVVADKTKVDKVFEVSVHAAAAAWPASVAAARRHGVVLLTDGSQQSPGTTRWLARHPDVKKRYAVGRGAAAADPDAVAIVGADAAATATLVAQRFFASPALLGVASSTLPLAGRVAAARLAVAGGPLLLSGSTRLPQPVRGYIATVRAGVLRADLIGDQLPYADVERDLQRSLLG